MLVPTMGTGGAVSNMDKGCSGTKIMFCNTTASGSVVNLMDMEKYIISGEILNLRANLLRGGHKAQGSTGLTTSMSSESVQF